MNKKTLIPQHGGYRNLHSFKTAQIVYDSTVIFCNRFVSRFSRTQDQMVQAARSGVQNIAEGSVASATSKKTELKLTNVAKASLEELLLDYEDYLRQRGLKQWKTESPQAVFIRQIRFSDMSDLSDTSEPYCLTTTRDEVAANVLICLINQACFLLRKQLQKLEREFLEEGGFTERLYKVRSAQKQRNGFR